MSDDIPGVPDAAWLKSTFCQTSSCVEISRQGDRIELRNSREPATVVRYTPDEWAAFTSGLRVGEFDHLLGQ